MSNVLAQVTRVSYTVLTQTYSVLRSIKRDLFLRDDPLARRRVNITQPFHNVSVDDRLMDDFIDIFGGYFLVEDIARFDY